MADTNKTVTDLQESVTGLQDELKTLSYISQTDITTSDLRKAYAAKLAEIGDKDRASTIMDYDLLEPIFNKYEFNPEEEPEDKILQYIPLDAAIDANCIDNTIINGAEKYAALITGSIKRMNAVKKRLYVNAQRINDINFITNTYNNFSTIRTVTPDNLSGSYSHADNTFCCFASKANVLTISADSVTGNGYIGNNYVEDASGNMLHSTIDTSDLDNITDSSYNSTFEYSRLCGCSDDFKDNDQVNVDDKPVTCTIAFSSATYVNSIQIDTNCSDLIVKDILVSNDDGKTYNSSFSKDVPLSSLGYDKYNVSGSNIVCFPKAKSFKVVLQSNYSFPNESLSYPKTTITADKESTTQYHPFKNTIRKVISINKITAFCNTYVSSAMMTDQLITDNEQYKTVGVFANEYIPEYFNDKSDYIKYVLIINGKEYSLEPINSQSNSNKMISYADYQYNNTNITYIDEPIKSVQLKVVFTPYDANSTAFLSNLKVCLG